MLYIPGYVLQICGTNDTGIQKHALTAAYFMFGGTRDASCVPHDIEVSRDTSTVHHCEMRGGGCINAGIRHRDTTDLHAPPYIHSTVSYKRPNKKLNICYNFARHTLYDTAYRNDPITRSDKQYSTSTENSELRAASAQYTLTFVLAYYVYLQSTCLLGTVRGVRIRALLFVTLIPDTLSTYRFTTSVLVQQ